MILTVNYVLVLHARPPHGRERLHLSLGAVGEMK